MKIETATVFAQGLSLCLVVQTGKGRYKQFQANVLRPQGISTTSYPTSRGSATASTPLFEQDPHELLAFLLDNRCYDLGETLGALLEFAEAYEPVKTFVNYEAGHRALDELKGVEHKLLLADRMFIARMRETAPKQWTAKDVARAIRHAREVQEL